MSSAAIDQEDSDYGSDALSTLESDCERLTRGTSNATSQAMRPRAALWETTW